MFLNTRNDNDHSLSSLREVLSNEGSCLVSDENLFLTVDQWKTLNHETSKLAYEKVLSENAEKPLSFKVSTIKCSGIEDIKNKPIYDVISSVQSRKFIASLTGLHHFNIDRCECHLCEEGDFISHHWSKDNFDNYNYVINFFLEGNYGGGQLIIYQPDKKENVYTPKSGEILISSCPSKHEIKPVLSGKRNHVLAFIQAYAPQEKTSKVIS